MEGWAADPYAVIPLRGGAGRTFRGLPGTAPQGWFSELNQGPQARMTLSGGVFFLGNPRRPKTEPPLHPLHPC